MKALETVITVLVVFVLITAGVFWLAYLVMLCMGGIGHMTNHLGLAIGFWPSFLITLMLSLFIGGSSKS